MSNIRDVKAKLLELIDRISKLIPDQTYIDLLDTLSKLENTDNPYICDVEFLIRAATIVATTADGTPITIPIDQSNVIIRH